MPTSQGQGRVVEWFVNIPIGLGACGIDSLHNSESERSRVVVVYS